MKKMIKHGMTFLQVVQKMCLNPEGPKGEMPDIKSSARIKVATQRDETEDVEIFGTPKAPMENVSLLFASTEPTNKPTTEITFVEMPTPEVPPPIEAAGAEHITTRDILTETTQVRQLALRLLSQPRSLHVMLEVF